MSLRCILLDKNSDRVPVPTRQHERTERITKDRPQLVFLLPLLCRILHVTDPPRADRVMKDAPHLVFVSPVYVILLPLNFCVYGTDGSQRR